LSGGFPSSPRQKLGAMIASKDVMASKDAATGKLAPRDRGSTRHPRLP
jgi:hypothetical protein